MTPEELSNRLSQDYGDKLIELGGKKYLEVKWRIHALTRYFPDAQVFTDFVGFTPDGLGAVAKARVVIPSSDPNIPARVAENLAMHKSTTHAQDNIANAATSALGRALAIIGIGTQFAMQDFDEPKHQPVSDAPVASNVRQMPQRTQQRIAQPTTPQQPQPVGNPPTERQTKMLNALVFNEFGGDWAAATAWSGDRRKFDRQQVSAMIEYLKNREGAQLTGTGQLDDIADVLSGRATAAPEPTPTPPDDEPWPDDDNPDNQQAGFPF